MQWLIFYRKLNQVENTKIIGLYVYSKLVLWIFGSLPCVMPLRFLLETLSAGNKLLLALWVGLTRNNKLFFVDSVTIFLFIYRLRWECVCYHCVPQCNCWEIIIVPLFIFHCSSWITCWTSLYMTGIGKDSFYWSCLSHVIVTMSSSWESVVIYPLAILLYKLWNWNIAFITFLLCVKSKGLWCQTHIHNMFFRYDMELRMNNEPEFILGSKPTFMCLSLLWVSYY